MNITFIILLLAVFTLVYLVQHLFKVNVKGAHQYTWWLAVALTLVLAEACLTLLGGIYHLPHFYLITFPMKFMVPVILLLIGMRELGVQAKPAFFKKRPRLVTLPIYLLLLPIFSLDAPEKLEVIHQTPNGVVLLTWLLLLVNIMALVRLFVLRQATTKGRLASMWMIVALTPYTLIQGVGVVLPSLMPFIDVIAVVVVGTFFATFRVKSLSALRQSNTALIEQIKVAVIEQKLFLKPNLSLNALSRELGKTPNQISKAINSTMAMSFNNFINECRVNEVIALLKDQKNEKFTLEGISKMAGFNSTTTFNAAFKKATGKTPVEYKRLTKS